MAKNKKNGVQKAIKMMCTGCGKTVKDIEKNCHECGNKHPRLRCSKWYYKDGGDKSGKGIQILFHTHTGKEWSWVEGSQDDKYDLVCSSFHGAIKKPCAKKTCGKCTAANPPASCNPNRCKTAERIMQKGIERLMFDTLEPTVIHEQRVDEEDSEEDAGGDAHALKPSIRTDLDAGDMEEVSDVEDTEDTKYIEITSESPAKPATTANAKPGFALGAGAGAFAILMEEDLAEPVLSTAPSTTAPPASATKPPIFLPFSTPPAGMELDSLSLEDDDGHKLVLNDPAKIQRVLAGIGAAAQAEFNGMIESKMKSAARAAKLAAIQQVETQLASLDQRCRGKLQQLFDDGLISIQDGPEAGKSKNGKPRPVKDWDGDNVVQYMMSTAMSLGVRVANLTDQIERLQEERERVSVVGEEVSLLTKENQFHTEKLALLVEKKKAVEAEK